MKKFNVSLAVIAALSFYSSANAQSLQEALTDGKISGEFTATYETRNMNKSIERAFDTTKGEDVGGWYRDSGSAVGSFALKYETGVWNDLSLTSKFRAYKTLFEDDDNAATGQGNGDATERFFEKDGNHRTADIEELFLTYAPNDDFTVKAGRQFISSHWINKTHDAVRINAAFGNTSLEAIWTLRDGRVYSRDYRPVEKVNENKGVYQLALTHKFNDAFSATVYDRIEPDVRDILGAKINAKLGSVSLGAHYAMTKEDVTGKEDANLLHLTASTSIAGFSPYIGYIKASDEKFEGWTSTGETIDPMEEGDYIYEQGAETVYLGVSKSFGDLSATLLHGMMKYGTTTKYKANETTLWLGYPVTKDLKANLGYTVVDETSAAAHGDYDQLNLTLTYSF